jgi:hypothetical protein
MSAHAFLSASGSKIWLACTPSARAQEHYPDEESVFSREGTFAHGLATARLEIQLKRNKNALNEFYAANADAWKEFYNQELADYVEGYVTRCMELIERVLAECPDAIVLLEQRLDFSRWVPEGFGTGDLVIVGDLVLYVRDLKYGKGVWVDAQDNSQTRLYAGGALDTYGALYGFEEIDVGIDQPRLGNLDQERLGRAELEKWLDEHVAPAAQLAWNGEGLFVAGDHCTFCRARHGCAERAKYNTTALEHYDPDADFSVMAPTLTEEQVAKVLPRIDDFIRWAKDLKSWALREQVMGRKQWPGLKLVQGRSVRKIVNPDALADRLIKHGGVEEALIYERSLLGITELERVVGKKKFAELTKVPEGFDPIIKKPPGKPKLVPLSDPRLAWTPDDAAAIEFDDFKENDE